MITYSMTKEITDEQLRQLYTSVGWCAYTNTFDDLSILLDKAIQVITAWDNNKLVGLIRTIGDGVYVEVIQDLLVLPEYQGNGIGKYLLTRACEGAEDKKQVFLLTESGAENKKALSFYSKQPYFSAFSDISITGFYKTQHILK
ncbi:GNAT family N-acetyltransferase [Carnobacteriaceae bacterium zg-ZUI78]|nr:GNAT family N-acetyltransferase [Carnobacteriaceae bacterium zg-ZUI78]NEW65515.1 GNAT family N-acetyltransferase [Granulicatella sp. zg-84]QMI85600.1 GNAT family N-acetyltransferase [Carnobacteriaceae bacterium zg-84]